MNSIDNYKNVLVIRLSAIGDVLRTLPAVNAWRQHYPETRFTWLVEPAAASVLEGHLALDRILIFERDLFSGYLRSPKRLGRALVSLFMLLGKLRSENFDLVVDFHGIFKSGLFAKLSGVSDRAGFARPDAKEGSHLFYNRHFRLATPELNRVERAFGLIEFLGLQFEGPISYQLPVTVGHHQRAHASLAELEKQGRRTAYRPPSRQ